MSEHQEKEQEKKQNLIRMPQLSFFNGVPPEIDRLILKKLAYTDLLQMSKVNTQWNEIIFNFFLQRNSAFAMQHREAWLKANVMRQENKIKPEKNNPNFFKFLERTRHNSVYNTNLFYLLELFLKKDWDETDFLKFRLMGLEKKSIPSSRIFLKDIKNIKFLYQYGLFVVENNLCFSSIDLAEFFNYLADRFIKAPGKGLKNRLQELPINYNLDKVGLMTLEMWLLMLAYSNDVVAERMIISHIRSALYHKAKTARSTALFCTQHWFRKKNNRNQEMAIYILDDIFSIVLDEQDPLSEGALGCIKAWFSNEGLLDKSTAEVMVIEVNTMNHRFKNNFFEYWLNSKVYAGLTTQLETIAKNIISDYCCLNDPFFKIAKLAFQKIFTVNPNFILDRIVIKSLIPLLKCPSVANNVLFCWDLWLTNRNLVDIGIVQAKSIIKSLIIMFSQVNRNSHAINLALINCMEKWLPNSEFRKLIKSEDRRFIVDQCLFPFLNQIMIVGWEEELSTGFKVLLWLKPESADQILLKHIIHMPLEAWLAYIVVAGKEKFQQMALKAFKKGHQDNKMDFFALRSLKEMIKSHLLTEVVIEKIMFEGVFPLINHVDDFESLLDLLQAWIKYLPPNQQALACLRKYMTDTPLFQQAMKSNLELLIFRCKIAENYLEAIKILKMCICFVFKSQKNSLNYTLLLNFISIEFKGYIDCEIITGVTDHLIKILDVENVNDSKQGFYEIALPAILNFIDRYLPEEKKQGEILQALAKVLGEYNIHNQGIANLVRKMIDKNNRQFALKFIKPILFLLIYYSVQLSTEIVKIFIDKYYLNEQDKAQFACELLSLLEPSDEPRNSSILSVLLYLLNTGGLLPVNLNQISQVLLRKETLFSHNKMFVDLYKEVQHLKSEEQFSSLRARIV
jgi:hypothetical protein